MLGHMPRLLCISKNRLYLKDSKRWTPLDSAGLRWTLLELQEYRHLRRTQAVNKGDPGDLRDALPEWGGSSLSRDLPGRSWAH